MIDDFNTSGTNMVHFYNGGSKELEELASEFVHEFIKHESDPYDSGITSSFTVFSSQSIRKVMDRLTSAVESGSNNLQDEVHDNSRWFNDMNDEGSVRYLGHIVLSVVSLRDMTPDESFGIISRKLDDLSRYVPGHACFHFNITNAMLEQAFMVCKLSAIFPLVTFVNHNGRDPSILAPFPGYIHLNDSQYEILAMFLEEKIHPTPSGFHKSESGFLTKGDVKVLAAEYHIRNVNENIDFLLNNYLIAYGGEVRKALGRPADQYRITDYGEFIYNYTSRSRWDKDDMFYHPEYYCGKKL